MSWKANILKVADVTMGRALCVALAPFARRRKRNPLCDVKRILVIRPGGIGDAVLFIPMLQSLKGAFPEAQIDLLMEGRNAGVIPAAGLAEEVLRYDRSPSALLTLRKRRYDVVIDTEQYHCLSAIVAFLTGAAVRIGFDTNLRRQMFTETVPYDQDLYEVYSFLRLAGVLTGREHPWDPDEPFYPQSDEGARFAEQALRPLESRYLVAIHPGASIPERQWPPERYGQLAAMLSDRGMGIVILGGKTDVAAAARIADILQGRDFVNLAGRCSLVEAASVVARVSVYVSADSGVLHLAYGVGTPTVHLFGPGVLSKWGPPGRKFITVSNPVECSPCTRYGYTPPCCQGLTCMMGIAPEDVFKATMDQLNERMLQHG